jgi:hypothetical protein
VAAGRLGALLIASSVLHDLESLGNIQDVVVTATIFDDTRALPFLDPDATPPAIILDAHGRLDALDLMNDAIVQEQQQRSRRQHPATKTHLYAV